MESTLTAGNDANCNLARDQLTLVPASQSTFTPQVAPRIEIVDWILYAPQYHAIILVLVLIALGLLININRMVTKR
jgi:hypothetical protein